MNLFVVGKIIGCFGIHGYVKVQPTTHSLDRLEKLYEVFIGKSTERATPYTVEDAIVKRELIKLMTINDRTSAEQIVGHFLFVEKKDVELPQNGIYFIHDVIGCDVWSTDGRKFGVVEDVFKRAPQDLWAIRYKSRIHLVPAVKKFIKEVDLKNRKVIIEMIDGLIEE